MILVIDLEATCSDDESIHSSEMEIIEIGAVWATFDGVVLDRFQRYVKPMKHPVLTAFCKNLTHIDQAQIDSAHRWDAVVDELAAFARSHEAKFWGSWGNYDARQIESECRLYGIRDPLPHLMHRNLKAEFAKSRKIKQVGMKTALHMDGLELKGEHHRALADAQNIARLLPAITR